MLLANRGERGVGADEPPKAIRLSEHCLYLISYMPERLQGRYLKPGDDKDDGCSEARYNCLNGAGTIGKSEDEAIDNDIQSDLDHHKYRELCKRRTEFLQKLSDKKCLGEFLQQK